MTSGNRIGIPTIIPFARRKSQSNIPSHYKNKQGLGNDLLESRFNYLQTCLNTFDDFENTKNLNVLKQFVISNSLTLKQLVNQVYVLKQTVEGESKDINLIYDKQYQKLNKQNDSLKKQLEIQKKKQQRIRYQYQQQNTGARGEQQIILLEQTITKLRKQADELNKRNESIAPNLMKKNFFKQFEKIHRQCEGLHRQNDKLKQIIKQKKEELQMLRT